VALASGYGATLKRAMLVRGMTVERLSREAKVNRGYICALRAGKSMPRLGVATRLAEALDWESLHTMAAEARKRTCSICDAAFVADHRVLTRRIYCSVRCGSVARARRGAAHGKAVKERRSAINAYRLQVYQEKVNAHCWTCEPSGLCQTPTCDLREVSPLSLDDAA
jgi:hypothetical protein